MIDASTRRRLLRRWLPRAPRLPPFAASRPKSAVHWLSVAVVTGVFVFFLAVWVRANLGYLFDPMLQNDDARSAVVPFHRYEPGHPLRDDPIANEMLSIVPPFVRLFYAAFVPLSGLFFAAKLVQIVCLLIVAWAGFVLARARRGGLAAGLLLVFFVLHTTFMVDRIAGGLPRAFAFPAFALWIAGALAGRERERFLGAAIGCAAYPSAGVLLVAADGLFAVRGLALRRKGLGFPPALRDRLRRYGVLVAACGAILFSSQIGRPGGAVYTLAQAQHEPAYGMSGRVWVLPFTDPRVEITKQLVRPFEELWPTPRGQDAVHEYQSYRFLGPMLVVLGLVLLAALRLAPASPAVWSFLGGSIIMYAAAIVLAFRLYSPGRYLEYGLPACTVALAVSTVGLLLPRMRRARRAVARNLAGAAMIAAVMAITGGSRENQGMTIDGRRDAPLYAFVKTLPIDARFASHPLDGDDLPFWASRATLVGFETLVPWFVDGWKLVRTRAEDTLRALYATDRRAVLDYAAKYHVTHFLLRPDRYGPDFSGRARMFEPLGTFAGQVTRAVARRDDLVLADPPAEAIVYRNGPWMIVDVAKLAQAWGM